MPPLVMECRTFLLTKHPQVDKFPEFLADLPVESTTCVKNLIVTFCSNH